MIRRPPRSTLSSSSAASDVYKRQGRGFKRGQVTHIYGEAGAGKSQIGLSTLVDRASRGFGAVYLVSEDIPQGRLREIAESVAFRTISSSSGGNDEDVDPDTEMVTRVTTSILERIFVRKIQSMTHLHEVLGGSAFTAFLLSLIHISEPTRLLSISYAVFCLKKKNIK
eukprot:TRINITY_DN63277_c0_g1_i1.p1 TRINITY_DN63277_c0_g1~~TRINITY_DN63277_c0_g1_i1.p1  ORF type:complete len:168 (+),score=31.64 TRINITY_DN63277_c0_g1_i1:55-558(+)